MKAVPDIWKKYNDASEKLRLSLIQADNRELLRFDYIKELEMIGTELHRLRIAKGYSVEVVAKALKVSKFNLCKIEHGLYISFDVRHLYRLSALYDTTPQKILSVIPGTLFKDPNYQIE
jgi:DNA-binding XRE family transcriptional regulator